MSLAFFAFGRGLGSSLRGSSGLGVLEARFTAVPGADATEQQQCDRDVAHRPASRMVRTGLDMRHCFGAAGCRRLCWMPAAASRRSSTRRMLELQRFAAVHSGCRCRLQQLCGNRIAMLPLFSLVSEQQQELLRLVESVREADERAFQRGRSGCSSRAGGGCGEQWALACGRASF